MSKDTAIEETKTKLEDTRRRIFARQNILTYLCWALLAVAFASSIWTQNWNMFFLSGVVFGLTLLPFVFQSWSEINIPSGFVACMIFFIVATVFLGEIGDFYERFEWWDTFLHTGSAIGFAMIGMLIILFLLRGDHLAAPPIMLGLMAFSFAVAIGGIWEIFEYAMDQLFGMNMQRDGLHDTMKDLIVDVIGAFVGSVAGVIYLLKGGSNFLSSTIDSFVDENPEIFVEN